MDDENLKKIWELISNEKDLNKKKLMIDRLSDDDITKLQFCTNPYRKPIYQSSAKYAAVSNINMREEDTRNFMMTSIVGFMYKMAIEYEPFKNNTENLPSETEGEFAKQLSDLYQYYFIVNNVNRYYTTITTSFAGSSAGSTGSTNSIDTNDTTSFTTSTTSEAGSRAGSTGSIITYYRACSIGTDRLKIFNGNKDYTFLNFKDPLFDIKIDYTKLATNLCKEHGIKYEECYPIDIPTSTEEFDMLRELLKTELGITKTFQDKERDAKDTILDFLDKYFCFDPNNHIRCGYMPNYDKVLQEKLSKNPENFSYYPSHSTHPAHPASQYDKDDKDEQDDKDKQDNKDEKDNTTHPSHPYHPYHPAKQDDQDDQDEKRLLITDKFEEYLVPPKDTFYSFQSYYENNYEYLRQCTDDIYGPVKTFENAYIVREVFDSPENAKKWVTKHKTVFDCDIDIVEMNNWIFKDKWEQNRENLLLIDEKNKFISEFIDEKQKDSKFAEDIIKKKVRSMPNRNNKSMSAMNNLSQYGINKFNEGELENKIFTTRVLKTKRFKHVMDGFSFGSEPDK